MAYDNAYTMVPQQINRISDTLRATIAGENQQRLSMAGLRLKGQQQQAQIDERAFQRFMQTPMPVEQIVDNFPGIDDDQKKALKNMESIKFLIHRGEVVTPAKLYDAYTRVQDQKREDQQLEEKYEHEIALNTLGQKPQDYRATQKGYGEYLQMRRDVAGIKAGAKKMKSTASEKAKVKALSKAYTDIQDLLTDGVDEFGEPLDANTVQELQVKSQGILMAIDAVEGGYKLEIDQQTGMIRAVYPDGKTKIISGQTAGGSLGPPQEPATVEGIGLMSAHHTATPTLAPTQRPRRGPYITTGERSGVPTVTQGTPPGTSYMVKPEKETPVLPGNLEALEQAIPPREKTSYGYGAGETVPYPWETKTWSQSASENLAQFTGQTQTTQAANLPRMGEDAATTAIRIATGVQDLAQLNQIKAKIKYVYKLTDEQIAQAIQNGQLFAQ